MFLSVKIIITCTFDLPSDLGPSVSLLPNEKVVRGKEYFKSHLESSHRAFIPFNFQPDVFTIFFVINNINY